MAGELFFKFTATGKKMSWLGTEVHFFIKRNGTILNSACFNNMCIYSMYPCILYNIKNNNIFPPTDKHWLSCYNGTCQKVGYIRQQVDVLEALKMDKTLTRANLDGFTTESEYFQNGRSCGVFPACSGHRCQGSFMRVCCVRFLFNAMHHVIHCQWFALSTNKFTNALTVYQRTKKYNSFTVQLC